MAVVRRSRAGASRGRTLRAVGAYIFAGGFTVGVQEHFQVVAHLEDGPFGADTARRNFPKLPVYEVMDEWPVDELRKSGVDFVYANPPCAPFSVANFGGKNWRTDGRLSCIHRTFSLLDELKPTVWAFESVRGAWKLAREMMEDLASRGAESGYATYHVMTNAANHGVPQSRPRYFLVLSKVRIDWEPSRRDCPTSGKLLKSARKGGLLANTSELHAKLLKHCSPGDRLSKVFNRLNADTVRRHEERKLAVLSRVDRMENFTAFKKAAWAGRMPGRPSFSKMRLDPDDLAPVVTGTAQIFHPSQDRKLSVNEVAALCTYPRNFEFVARSASDAYAQVGRAVMPNVGEYIGRTVAAAIRGDKRVKRSQLSRPQLVTIHRDSVDVEVLEP